MATVYRKRRSMLGTHRSSLAPLSLPTVTTHANTSSKSERVNTRLSTFNNLLNTRRSVAPYQLCGWSDSEAKGDTENTSEDKLEPANLFSPDGKAKAIKTNHLKPSKINVSPTLNEDSFLKHEVVFAIEESTKKCAGEENANADSAIISSEEDNSHFTNRSKVRKRLSLNVAEPKSKAEAFKQLSQIVEEKEHSGSGGFLALATSDDSYCSEKSTSNKTGEIGSLLENLLKRQNELESAYEKNLREATKNYERVKEHGEELKKLRNLLISKISGGSSSDLKTPAEILASGSSSIDGNFTKSDSKDVKMDGCEPISGGSLQSDSQSNSDVKDTTPSVPAKRVLQEIRENIAFLKTPRRVTRQHSRQSALLTPHSMAFTLQKQYEKLLD